GIRDLIVTGVQTCALPISLAGYGYGGFWTPARISMISDDQQWSITSSHSEYLEIALDLGVIGLALYVVTFGAAIRRAARFAAQKDRKSTRLNSSHDQISYA